MADTIGSFIGALALLGAGDPPQSGGGVYPFLFVPPEADTPPVVANFVPPPGAISRYQALQFDVTDNHEVTALVVSVRFEPVPPSTNRAKDVVFDAEGFADAYVARSTVQTIPGGYRFRVLREGGWPSAPRIAVLAADGLVAT